MKTYRSLLLIIACALTISAQDSNVRLTFDTQLNTGLGYRNPSVGVGAGATHEFNHTWAVDGTVRFMRARKVDGGGFNVGGSFEVRRRLSPTMFALGGINVSHQTTSFYSKTALNPVVGIGWRVGDLYPSVRALLPDVTSPNKTYGADLQADYYVPTQGALGLFVGARVALVRFKCIQGPVGLTDNCIGASVTTEVGIYKTRTGRRF